MPGYWKLVLLAGKGWKRIPPAQRRKLLLEASRQARRHGPTVIAEARRQAKKHGPTVAKQVETAVRNARKAR
ncbi:MAG TPA: hypothetical protein VH306_01120 [Gaiellaceae bacterium]|jgi:hypothetical protein